jgi:hypothetical protein
MAEYFCSAFLVGFLVFYSALFLGLLVWGIRGVLRGVRKPRAAGTPGDARKPGVVPARTAELSQS